MGDVGDLVQLLEEVGIQNNLVFPGRRPYAQGTRQPLLRSPWMVSSWVKWLGEFGAVLVIYQLSAAGGSKVCRSVVAVSGLPLHGLLGSVDSDLHMLLLMAGVVRKVGAGGVAEEV